LQIPVEKKFQDTFLYVAVMFKIGQSSLSIRGDTKLHETTLKSGTPVGKFKAGTIHICERSDFITPLTPRDMRKTWERYFI